MSPDESVAAAKAYIESFLQRPVALVTDEVLVIQTDASNIVELPFQPVVSVDPVEYLDPSTLAALDPQPSPAPPYARVHSRLYGLPGLTWVRITYDHGWADADVPAVITTIQTALAARLLAADPGIRSEAVGQYHVDYGDGGSGPNLTAEEMKRLSRFGVKPRAATLRLDSLAT